MRFGLEENIIEKIIQVFEENSKVDKALIFGSRAKGDWRPDSDIDIAVKGFNITMDDILKMSVAFNDKGINYKIDLIDYNSIKEKALVEHIDRVGIEFYNSWKEYRLDELTELYNSKRSPLSSMERATRKGIFPYYGASGIIDSIDDYLFDGEYVLISEDGENLSSRQTPVAFKASGKFWVNNHAHIVKGKEEHLNNLLIYFFAGLDLTPYITGAVQPKLSKENLLSIPIWLPKSKEEQTAIVTILSSLDDKIDLLHHQNKTLEQLAETLFRQWFVEEVEESWKLEPLGKIFDIGIGRTPPRKEQHWFSTNPKDIKWVSIKDMGANGVYIENVSEYLTQEAVEKFNVPNIPENTVLLSFKMTIGRLAITMERMLSNEAIAHFKQKENSFLFPEFLYLFLKTYSWEQLGSTSSIVEAINSQMIKEIEMLIPEEQILNKFKDLITPYFYKIKSNQIQIRTLTQLRDTLLPKLMSGEVRVKMNN